MGKILMKKQADYKNYHDYKVYIDGTILSPNGRKLKRLSLTYRDSHVIMFFTGKRKSINIARLVYTLYADKKTAVELSSKYIIEFIDGKSTHPNFVNLRCVTKKEYLRKKNFSENNKKFDRKTVEEIKRQYPITKTERRKLQSQYNRGKYPSYAELAKKYDCSITTITKILNDNYFEVQ